jgi:serine/threonine protein kinase
MNLTTGTALRNGKYEIGAVVGPGCFQITYRATHVSSQQSVLIEALNESWRQHPQFNLFQRRFVERVRQIAKCRHRHFIRVLDLFAENGLVYMVTEAIDGSTLTESISDGKPLPLRVAFNLIRQVASALRALHHQDILHLNIKPDSIIQRQNSDRVVLANFSIVHHLTLGAIQTQAGMLSAGYAPPEQYDPQSQPTPATDVYALAATLYHLLTGQPPASASLRDRIPLANLRDVQPQISPALERAILQGLELSLDRRSPSIEAWMNPLWQEFSAIAQHLPTVQSPPVQSSPSPEDGVETESLPSPLAEVAVISDRFEARSILESTLPPQLQPWIPALFVATSAIAGIGGASFVFAHQSNSNVATAPVPEFSRLQEAFPSRSAQSNFGPDRAFVEAADPEATADEPTDTLAPSGDPYPHNPDPDLSGESAGLPVRTPAETSPEVEFPLEIESWQSRQRIPTAADPESDAELAEPTADDQLEEEQRDRDQRPQLEPSPSNSNIETSQSEPILSPRSIEIPEYPTQTPSVEMPEYPTQTPSKASTDVYFIPKSPVEFSAPKQSKPHMTTPDAGSWSKMTPL